MKNYPYILPTREAFIEVVDEHDKPIMVIPEGHSLQYNISHRKVSIILYDAQRRIFLIKPEKSKGLVIPSTRVYAGEAREYAATRLIKTILKLDPNYPLHMEPRTIKQYKYNTFFLIHLNEEYQKSLGTKAFWLDLDELDGFVAHFSDMLDKSLLELITQGHLEYLYSTI